MDIDEQSRMAVETRELLTQFENRTRPFYSVDGEFTTIKLEKFFAPGTTVTASSRKGAKVALAYALRMLADELLREGQREPTPEERQATILLNGKTLLVDRATSYEKLVELAGLQGTPMMTMREMNGRKSMDRFIRPGSQLFLAKGSVFMITAGHTGAA